MIGRSERERSYRRALWIGLAASLLLHLLLFLVVGRAQVGRRSTPSPTRPPEALQGLVLVDPDRLAAAEEQPGPRRIEEAPPSRPILPTAPRGPERLPAGEPEPEEGDRLSNAERLRPRMGDERLWIDFRDPLRPGFRMDRYAEAVDRLREIVRVWLDSLQLSEEQRRRALDWTFGEGDERWGVSPEGLHLGKVTIPIPFGALFQQGGPLGREAEQAVRDLQAIRAQEVRRELEETLEERREAMRERSREEAERREKDTTGGRGPPPRSP